MNKNSFPVLITLAQIISFGHLYYVNKYGNSHIPIALIEGTIISFLNLIFLIGLYFFRHKVKKMSTLWIAPVSLAGLMIVIVLILYVSMIFNKYN
jgi:hypothetical protein